MQTRQLFHVSLKIVGLFAVIWSLNNLFGLIPIYFINLDQPDLPNDMQFSVRFSIFIQTLAPIILFVIGIYLLKDGKAVTNSVFPENEDQQPGYLPEVAFTTTIKILGLVLIVYALPKSFGILSHLAYLNTAAPVIDQSDNIEYLSRNLLPILTYLGLGIYLLKGGKFLYRQAFAKDK